MIPITVEVHHHHHHKSHAFGRGGPTKPKEGPKEDAEATTTTTTTTIMDRGGRLVVEAESPPHVARLLPVEFIGGSRPPQQQQQQQQPPPLPRPPPPPLLSSYNYVDSLGRRYTCVSENEILMRGGSGTGRESPPPPKPVQPPPLPSHRFHLPPDNRDRSYQTTRYYTSIAPSGKHHPAPWRSQTRWQDRNTPLVAPPSMRRSDVHVNWPEERQPTVCHSAHSTERWKKPSAAAAPQPPPPSTQHASMYHRLAVSSKPKWNWQHMPSRIEPTKVVRSAFEHHELPRAGAQNTNYARQPHHHHHHHHHEQHHHHQHRRVVVAISNEEGSPKELEGPGTTSPGGAGLKRNISESPHNNRSSSSSSSRNISNSPDAPTKRAKGLDGLELLVMAAIEMGPQKENGISKESVVEGVLNPQATTATVAVMTKPTTVAAAVSAEAMRKKQAAQTGCSCPKSKCVALYCECFKAGRRCEPSLCTCVDCKNTIDESGPLGARTQAIRSILARNPRAFSTLSNAPKPPLAPGEVACNCIRSRCLKLYCTCFQNGRACQPGVCSCVGCLNTESHDDRKFAIQSILQKRPDAFNIRVKEVGLGCACKNNRCIRKYCECFRNGLACTDKCSCTNCENKTTIV